MLSVALSLDLISGGIRNVSLLVEGKDVYKYLKYESGVHRVQRIPITEKNSRIHTSTASIAVLPHPSEVNDRQQNY